MIVDVGIVKLVFLIFVYLFVVSTIEGVIMTVSVIDVNGNSVEGIKVNFRGIFVTLSSISVETDDRGFVEIFVISIEVGLKIVLVFLVDKFIEVISRLLNVSVDVNFATIISLEISEG